MKVKFLTLTLLSQLAIAAHSTVTFAATEVTVNTIPVLVEADKAFLGQKITYQFDFPTDARDQIVNEAARFMNQTQFSTSMTYQDLLEDLIKEDEYFSTENKENPTPLIPGAFLDAASALYREAADVISTEDFEIGTASERGGRAAEEKANFIKFADILEKEAKIVGTKPIDAQQSVAALKIQLDSAMKSGKHYKKVYVYSDGEYYQDDYRKLMLDYPDIEIVFRLFPEDMNVFFTESENVNDGIIFIERLPAYYRPYYDPIWYPYYDHYLSIDPYFLGFAYPYSVRGYWDGYYGRYGSDYWGGWEHDHWRSNRFGDQNWHENWTKNRRIPRDQQLHQAMLSREGNQPRGYHLNRQMGQNSGAITRADRTQNRLNKSALGHDRAATKTDRAQNRLNKSALGHDRAATKADRSQNAQQHQRASAQQHQQAPAQHQQRASAQQHQQAPAQQHQQRASAQQQNKAPAQHQQRAPAQQHQQAPTQQHQQAPAQQHQQAPAQQQQRAPAQQQQRAPAQQHQQAPAPSGGGHAQHQQAPSPATGGGGGHGGQVKEKH